MRNTIARGRIPCMHGLARSVSIPTLILILSSIGGAEEAVRATRRLHLPPLPFNYRTHGLLTSESDSETRHLGPKTATLFDNTPKSNPITDHGATLGRVLFYDTKLSANNTTSCASCHQQKYAFTDPRKLSVGFAGEKVTRNSMSLVNLRYYPNGRMFWDERAATLEQQVLMPIENDVEMGHSLRQLVKDLSHDPIYHPLFVNAFGDERVTQQRIARALAQFVRSIVSFRSRYDEGRLQVDSVLDPFPNFTEQENYGKEQFFGRGRCASCHLENLASSSDLEDDDVVSSNRNRQSLFFFVRKATVNGIDNEDAEDQGVAEHSGRPEDIGRFKVPSLRNIEATGPYMHDGRFHTLDQVVEHYNWSVRPHPNLDKRLESAVRGIALPELEKVALTQFLLTLTDQNLLHDERFSDPFLVR